MQWHKFLFVIKVILSGEFHYFWLFFRSSDVHPCFAAAMKMIQVERDFAEKHYSDLSTKPFFSSLVEYIISGPVVAMVWQGKGVVATGRKIIGATNPAASEPGTIRGDYCIEVSRNIIHGSDAVESAQKEIALWFPDGIIDWRSANHSWIYEN
ncbi:hypothetical protein M758_6G080200 [Ceratodon purpureus]|uniref:Nucleoside diphosphate kinase n=1 Tax=Ceratodon purpureus TaxID=3225 RepID=A0A8T0HFE7_CERPU|nr:hypothetical protein KC19_6G084800 [Ceratodon purpureus]KAG0613148.1 hypothetical protein M758_6G080200 [Ceratodon purpureus]